MTTQTRQFTGRHFLMVMIAAFATIISANLTLAYFAVGSFPGLDVANTYVASQQFDQKRRAQEALGWQTQLTYDHAVLALQFKKADGTRATPKELVLKIGGAASGQQDQALNFHENDGIYAAPVTLGDGNWVVFIEAVADDGTQFSERRMVPVP